MRYRLPIAVSCDSVCQIMTLFVATTGMFLMSNYSVGQEDLFGDFDSSTSNGEAVGEDQPTANEQSPSRGREGTRGSYERGRYSSTESQQIPQEQYQEALRQFNAINVQLAEYARQRNQYEQTLDAMRAELEAQRQRQLQMTPLPSDAMPRAFELKRIKAANVAEVLGKIYSDAGMRIAVDEPRNLLLVLSDEKMAEAVQQLIAKLDTSAPASPEVEREPVAEPQTLQMRVVWLLDGLAEDEGKPAARSTNPEVVDALVELGFVNPRVVSHHITMINVRDDKPGAFDFGIPVLINQQAWSLRGQGYVSQAKQDRFALQIELEFHDPMGNTGRVSGAAYTPLRHYTVMGTTTILAWPTPDETSAEGTGSEFAGRGGRGGYGRGGGMIASPPSGPSPQSHLSAFVIYLDRAREFPANAAVDRQDDAFAF